MAHPNDPNYGQHHPNDPNYMGHPNDPNYGQQHPGQQQPVQYMNVHAAPQHVQQPMQVHHVELPAQHYVNGQPQQQHIGYQVHPGQQQQQQQQYMGNVSHLFLIKSIN